MPIADPPATGRFTSRYKLQHVGFTRPISTQARVFLERLGRPATSEEVAIGMDTTVPVEEVHGVLARRTDLFTRVEGGFWLTDEPLPPVVARDAAKAAAVPSDPALARLRVLAGQDGANGPAPCSIPGCERPRHVRRGSGVAITRCRQHQLEFQRGYRTRRP